MIPVVLLLTLSGFLSGINWKGKQDQIETFSVSAVTENEIKDELIIAVFIESIRKHVQDFYSEFYTGEVMVYNYETDILEVKKSNGLITVKFGVTPQIGAHNPLGYDELVYTVDSSGSGQMIEYEHIKDYPVPERFKERFYENYDFSWHALHI